MGIGHHIGPQGHLEPCPPIQFATEQYAVGDSLSKLHADSRFLAEFRETRQRIDRAVGCDAFGVICRARRQTSRRGGATQCNCRLQEITSLH
jgi:hypothetical protein